MNRIVTCPLRGACTFSRTFSTIPRKSNISRQRKVQLCLLPSRWMSSSPGPLKNISEKTVNIAAVGVVIGFTAFGVFYTRRTLESSKPTKTSKESKPPVEPKKPEKPVPPPFLPDHAQYLIIGAGTTAFTAYQEIKARDPKAKVWLIGKEKHIPYSRPYLSKYLWYLAPEKMSKWMESEHPVGSRSIYYESDSYYFSAEELLENENGGVCVLGGQNVTKLDADKRKVYLECGKEIGFDKCLIATGGKPRNLPIFKEASKQVQDRVTLFRSVDDFKKLYDLSSSAKSFVVIGGGFLGSELAVSLQNRATQDATGATVTQVFPEKGNLGLVLPEQLSKWLTSHVTSEGVTVLTERMVCSVGFENNQVVLNLSDNTQLKADQVVVAVGLEPSVDLAATAGLEVDSNLGGFLVNSELEARTNVWVAGDAACFYDRRLGRRRIEHYDNAEQSGRTAGQNMTGGGLSYTYQSTFWSDIGDMFMEAVGLVDSKLESTTFSELIKDVEDGDNRKVVFYRKGEDVVGILTMNIKRKAELGRRYIDSGLKEKDLQEVAKQFFAKEKEKSEKDSEDNSKNKTDTVSS
ncbi:apoptosis-inducing factor 1, mitochondrial-like [Mizuhopecten yessoensis]|uniref:Apoptosis-inducing factor 1, mitochondrial n=1 Tax=Mizuhopecten yessoensis TaxID=6573 RepID=A0A210QEF9_MIZYE|nr:apoptosis-inducing factor 1, mitochondrial-like [Mizuhopecten yessoensis]OWF47078.1 Apoptosis-inducing factor 1, mitochondrial [Mizuhopecten yessoensis]